MARQIVHDDDVAVGRRAGCFVWPRLCRLVRGQPSSYKRHGQLDLTPFEWRSLLERLKKRLTYLGDDDLLVPAFYRNYGKTWERQSGIREQLQSLGAWQLVSDELLMDTDTFTTDPDIVLADIVPEHVLNALEKCIALSEMTGIQMEIVFEPGRPGSLQEFEPWAYHYAMVDGAKHFLFKRTHHEARRNATSTLLLQHYGCPTSGLDITADPDCAGMFAFGDFNYNIIGAIKWGTGRKLDSKRCVYVLLMKDGRDPHLRSSVMFKGSKNESRIERQKCGILFGSSWACRNFAQRHIALKLELDFDLPGSIDPRFVSSSQRGLALRHDC